MTTTNLGMTIPTVGADSDTWGNELNTDLGLIDAFAGSLMPRAEVSIASAATCDIGAAASTAVAVSGTTAITSFGTGVSKIRFVRFTGALTLTHNATNLILLGGASRTTAAGDTGLYRSDASGNWRELAYASAAYNPSAHTGSGAYAHAASPTFSGTVSGADLSFGGSGFFSGNGTFNGTLLSQGNLSCANGSIISGNTVSATGFNVLHTMSWQGNFLSNTPANYDVVANSGGVRLPSGGTSWTALSSLEYKTDVMPIPGSARSRIKKLSGRLFRYHADAPDRPQRAGVIYEDVAQSDAFPWAAHYSPERVLTQTRTDEAGNEAVETHVQKESKTVSLEQLVPGLIDAVNELGEQLDAALADIQALKATAS
jgi:hypothetical protein